VYSGPATDQIIHKIDSFGQKAKK